MTARETNLHPKIRLLILALLVVLIHYSVPYGQYILYPFNLLFTWVHEMGHGVTALICGQQFELLEIFRSAGGVAHIGLSADVAWWQQAAIGIGGLLAPPFIGMLLLICSRSLARVTLFVFQFALLVSMLIWVRNPSDLPIGLLVVGTMWALVLAVALWTKNHFQTITVQFLGLVLSLYTIVRIDYLFMSQAHVGSQIRNSDISNLAHILGGPIQLWGLLLTGISFLFLAIGLYVAWRSPEKKKVAPSQY